MYDDVFAVLMVIALGLIFGGGIGLVLGYILRRQGPRWSAISSRLRWQNIAIVVACIAVVTAFFAWYSLYR
jgi:hypothetical protein